MTTWKVKVRDVLSYLSVEAVDFCCYFGTDTVRDFLFFGTEYNHGDVPYEVTLEALRTEGQKYPVHVGLGKDIARDYGIDPLGAEDKWVLGNGHNRVEAAFELDWEWIEVTDRKEESGLTAGIKVAREMEGLALLDD